MSSCPQPASLFGSVTGRLAFMSNVVRGRLRVCFRSMFLGSIVYFQCSWRGTCPRNGIALAERAKPIWTKPRGHRRFPDEQSQFGGLLLLSRYRSRRVSVEARRPHGNTRVGMLNIAEPTQTRG